MILPFLVIVHNCATRCSGVLLAIKVVCVSEGIIPNYIGSITNTSIWTRMSFYILLYRYLCVVTLRTICGENKRVIGG